MKAITISATVEEKHAEQIAEHAKHHKRSIRQLAGFAIAEWLDRNPLPKQKKSK